MKRLFCVATASVVLLSNELSVSAAGLKDVFDAEYYAEQYPDLQAAFGNNWDAYVKHYFAFGVNEHRENGLKIEDYYDAEGELDKTVHYAPNGNVTTFGYGYWLGGMHPTYNGEYIRNFEIKDAQDAYILRGDYYPAHGMALAYGDGETSFRKGCIYL